MWSLGLTPLHVSRPYWTSYGVCLAWLAVPTWLGCILEFSGSLVCGTATALIFDYEVFPAAGGLHTRVLLTSSLTTGLVLASFYRTGGFFQPLLAFVRTFGCVGATRPVSWLDHVLVYWAAASLGALAATAAAKWTRKLLLNCRRHKGHKTNQLLKHEKLEDPLLEHVEIY